MNIKQYIIRSHEAMKIECSKCEGSGYFSTTKQDSTIYDCLEICNQCNGTGTKPVNISKKLMAIITNLCKALECWESGDKSNDEDLYYFNTIVLRKEMKITYYKADILNTFESYLASVFIGLFDLCYIHKIEFKKDFDMLSGEIYEDFIVIIHNLTFCKSRENINEDINFLINKLTLLCNHHSINIDQHIKAKLEYLECIR